MTTPHQHDPTGEQSSSVRGDPSSIAPVWVIAGLAFQEARQRWLLWAALLLGVAYLSLFAVGLHFMYRDVSRSVGPALERLLEPVNFFLMAGLYGVSFMSVMMAVLLSVDTIAGEISSGSIQTLVTKPMRRWQFILGKWLGLAALLSLFILLLSGGIMAIVWTIAGHLPHHPFQGVALMLLQGLLVLTLSILGGTCLSTLTNGVVVFMLYGLAFVAAWIEQIGAFLRNQTAVNLGIAVSLIMPSEVMWKRAAYVMQPPFLRELGLDATPFGAASAPSGAMVVYAIVYMALALAFALIAFQRRDL
jgi:ABC-type transport system involved in multi-copper enzyme maturation permease subunit